MDELLEAIKEQFSADLFEMGLEDITDVPYSLEIDNLCRGLRQN